MDRLNLRSEVTFRQMLIGSLLLTALGAALIFSGCQQIVAPPAGPTSPTSTSETQVLPQVSLSETGTNLPMNLTDKGQFKIHMKRAHRRVNCLKSVHIFIKSVEVRKHHEDEGEDGDRDRDELFEGKFEHQENPGNDRCESRLVQNNENEFDDLNIEGLTSEIPPGEYSQLRLKIADSWAILDDDTRVELKIPSGAESGLKVMLTRPLRIERADDLKQIEKVFIELDFSHSFVFRGHSCSIANQNDVILNPVVRGSVVSTSGTVQGVIYSDRGTADLAADDEVVPDAFITVQSGGVTITTAQADSNGAYSIPALAEGTYDLLVDADLHTSQTVTGVVVTADGTITQDVLLSMVGGGTVTP
ncbi:carboxypeptidase regulatory-like domain-containing protein [Bdellovibrionota bacterium FG-2]